MKKLLSLLLLIGLVALGATSALAESPTYTEVWDGRGTDSEMCNLAGDYGRPETGWIHWVFNTKGESTNASLVLGGTGSGTYAPGEPLNANVWHFYTPYFELEGLTAEVQLFGGDPGTGGGLVISDYCPGLQEHLTVTKTAVTSYTREHFWDIDKWIETEKGYELGGFPKIWLYIDGSGNEKATWTVDVTYEGYEDRDFNVAGSITIENTGNVDAVITSVLDQLAGTLIDVDCGVAFPYTLTVGETLTCTYSQGVDGRIEGVNAVKVTTERGNKYQATAKIRWGDPTTEINKTVNVVDYSTLWGEFVFDPVTAPYGFTETYTKPFTWERYGADNCGSFRYDNTATIVETGQSASATLKVNVQCYIYEYETAYAKGDDAMCFIPTFRNWGWTNPILPGEYTWDLWAGAAQCDTSKGTLVGTVTVVYGPDGYVSVTYDVAPLHDLSEVHVYVGYEMFPQDRRGRATVAPGQYTNNSPFDGSQVYVIAHAVVGIPMPDPNFGP